MEDEKTKGFIFKLDIEKAFDKLSWDFIEYILEKKRYPTEWRSWISACVKNVNLSILINGKLYGRIFSNRGLRQATGLSINLSKSSLIPMNISNERSKEVENLWNIPIQNLSIDYLGVTLGGKPNSKAYWNKMDGKIQKKLNNWK